MTITGEVTKIFDIQEGITKMGAKWAKQDVLITQDNDYNAEVIVTGINEKAIKGIANLSLGSKVSIACNVNSREYNGKYYTNITGWQWVVLDKTGGSKDFATADDQDIF